MAIILHRDASNCPTLIQRHTMFRAPLLSKYADIIVRDSKGLSVRTFQHSDGFCHHTRPQPSALNLNDRVLGFGILVVGLAGSRSRFLGLGFLGTRNPNPSILNFLCQRRAHHQRSPPKKKFFMQGVSSGPGFPPWHGSQPHFTNNFKTNIKTILNKN